MHKTRATRSPHSLIMLTMIMLTLFPILFSSYLQVEDRSTPPNIIIILADDLGIGDVGCFNPEGKILTPSLDRLAAEGLRFTDAHTSSSVCTPTRYGLLTGRYNWRTRLKNGVLWGNSSALIKDDRSTLGSMLQQGGYHTAFIGKWHLGWDWTLNEGAGYDSLSHSCRIQDIDFGGPVKRGPETLGFDLAYGHIGSLDMPPYVYVENGRVTAAPDRVSVNKDSQGFWRKGPTGSDFVHEEVTPHFFQKAFEYIRESRDRDQPFFLYLPLPSPHTPILPSEEWQGKSGLDNPYADFVMMVDGYVGQLAELLEELDIDDNTVLVFTSDNGCSPLADYEALARKGHDPSYIYRGHKADIYEGGHRVPFIVRWPSVIDAGGISDQVICTTDLFRTLAAISGYEPGPDEGEDSYDLLPLFKDPDLPRTIREATVHHSINGSFAIRRGDWKLILCPGSGGWSYPKPKEAKQMDELPPLQLYDLARDPGEQVNLQASEPAVVAELEALLEKYRQEGRSTP